jgi:glycosyltransferase involved in cell wall biosynthesis
MAGIPLVSVLLPVRGGRYLAPALDSVLRQTDVDFEVICINDDADSVARAVLEESAAHCPRLRVLTNGGRGIADALNTGLAAARGELVARMDADDITLPSRLKTQAAFLETNPDLGVVGTQAVAIDGAGERVGKVRVPIGPERVLQYLQTGNPLIHPTVMMRRKLLDAVGGYRRSFDGAEDYDLWLRLSPLTAMDNLPEAFLLYRRHVSQLTIKAQFHQARLSALAIIAHRIRQSNTQDPFTDACNARADWAAVAAMHGPAFAELCELTASRLVDNRGTMRASGARYLNVACRRAIKYGSPETCQRMALACVRHQLLLLRTRRHFDALRAFTHDTWRWRTRLIAAYAKHASILMPARRTI